MSKNSKNMLCLAIIAVASFSANLATAAQTTNRNGQVVHTRVAPVIMHRAVPPYRGVHVYYRSYQRRSR